MAISSPFVSPAGRRTAVAVDVADAGRPSCIRMLECIESQGRYCFEGDILLTPLRTSAGAIVKRSVLFGNRIASSSGIWKNGIVPYDCDPSLISVVEPAIRMWQDATPLRFKPYNVERAYVIFLPGERNESHVGCIGSQQVVWLCSDASVATVAHEIGHVVGLWHEHSRSDRDSNIQLHQANIRGEEYHQFNQVSKDARFGAYDVSSIMHYDSFAFSHNGKPTITKMDGGLIPQNDRLSPGDIATVLSMYGG